MNILPRIKIKASWEYLLLQVLVGVSGVRSCKQKENTALPLSAYWMRIKFYGT